jgi:hypothetical protein
VVADAWGLRQRALSPLADSRELTAASHSLVIKEPWECTHVHKTQLSRVRGHFQQLFLGKFARRKRPVWAGAQVGATTVETRNTLDDIRHALRMPNAEAQLPAHAGEDA